LSRLPHFLQLKIAGGINVFHDAATPAASRRKMFENMAMIACTLGFDEPDLLVARLFVLGARKSPSRWNLP
jgi:hypothetical protein